MFFSPFNTEISRNRIRNNLAIIISEKKIMFSYELYKKYFSAKRLLTFDCRSILRSLNNKGYPPLYVYWLIYSNTDFVYYWRSQKNVEKVCWFNISDVILLYFVKCSNWMYLVIIQWMDSCIPKEEEEVKPLKLVMHRTSTCLEPQSYEF